MLQLSEYASATATNMLREAGRGAVSVDQRWMQAMLDKGPGIVEELCAYGKEPIEDRRVELDDDIIRLLRKLGGPAPVDYFLTLLRQVDEEPVEEFYEVVRLHREAFVEPLMELWESEELEDRQREEVNFLIASLGLPRERTAAFWEAMEQDADEAKFLEGFRENFALPGDDYDPLPEYPPVSAPDFDMLDTDEVLEWFAAASDEEKATALPVLEANGWPRELEGELVQLTLATHSDETRALAWKVLSVWTAAEGEDAPEFLSRARNTVNDLAQPPRVRAAALLSLAQADAAPDLNDQITEFYANSSTRDISLRLMGVSLDNRWDKQVMESLDAEDPDVIIEAIESAGALQIRAAHKQLQRWLMAEAFRPTALRSYTLTYPSEDKLANLRVVLRKVEEDAEGFEPGEELLVRDMLDIRLLRAGRSPAFVEEKPTIH
jgi:hypothetical protein